MASKTKSIEVKQAKEIEKMILALQRAINEVRGMKSHGNQEVAETASYVATSMAKLLTVARVGTSGGLKVIMDIAHEEEVERYRREQCYQSGRS